MGADTAALRRIRHDPVLRALLAVSVAAALAYGASAGSSTALSVAGWVVMGLIQVAQLRMCLTAAWLPGVPRSGRRFWLLFAAASGLFGVASACQVALALAQPGDPDVFSGGRGHGLALGAGAILLIAGLLTSPLGLAPGRQRFRFGLDAATVLIAVALLAWQVTGVGANIQSGGSVAGLAVALIGPAGFLVVAFGALKILLGGAAPFTPHAGLLGMAAAGMEGLTTGLAETLIGAGRGHWLLATAIVANAMFAGAVRVHLLEVRTDVTVLQRRPSRPYSMLPYATIVATYTLLVWVLATRGLTGESWAVLAGAILSTFIVVVRQVAAFADNSQLVKRLHAALGERDELARRLHYRAFHDTLTGVGNRAMFLQRLAEALAAGAGPVVVAVTDLDGFKPINDRLGHAAGDEVLREAAARLVGCVGDAGLVARLGGDEFAVLLVAPDEREVAELPRLVAATIGQPVALPDGAVRVGVSVGVARSRPGDDPSALIHRADLAMYADKRHPAAR